MRVRRGAVDRLQGARERAQLGGQHVAGGGRARRRRRGARGVVGRHLHHYVVHGLDRVLELFCFRRRRG